MTPARLFVLSGNGSVLEAIMKTTGGFQDVEVVRLEEKNIANIREMFRLLRSNRPGAMAFGCKDLTLQRYQFVLKTYLALSRAGTRFLLDESGQLNQWNAWKYLAVEIPRFVAELVASAWIIGYSYVRLTFLLKTTRRNYR